MGIQAHRKVILVAETFETKDKVVGALKRPIIQKRQSPRLA
jgi:hypothetical protein